MCLICRRLLRKNHFFREKSHKVPCIIAASWGEISFFGNFCSKTTMVMGKKVKLVLDMHAHFEEKITCFDRKVNKVICSIVAIWKKKSFLGIFVVKHTGLLGKKVKIMLDMQAHFEEKITFFGRKVNKVPCFIFAIWGKN